MFRQTSIPSLSMKPLSAQWADMKRGKFTPKTLFDFIRNVQRCGKLTEVTSFAWWAAQYRLRLLDTISFTDQRAVSIEEVLRSPPGLHNRLPALVPCAPDRFWKMYCAVGTSDAYAVKWTDEAAIYHIGPSGNPVKLAELLGEIASIFAVTTETVLISLYSGSIYVGGKGREFTKTLSLATEQSIFRFSYGATRLSAETVIIGEYGNVADNGRWRAIAYLYLTTDAGQTWSRSDFLVDNGVNKHVHAVRYISSNNTIAVTDGDNKKQVWSCTLRRPVPLSFDDLEWNLCNKRHRHIGGHTSLIELGGETVFGSDYLGGTNFVLRTKDFSSFEKQAIPEPYRRAPVEAMFLRSTDEGDEIWASLYNGSDSNVRSLLMVSSDQGSTWRRLIEYDGTQHRLHIASDVDSPLYICATSLDRSSLETPQMTFGVAGTMAS